MEPTTARPEPMTKVMEMTLLILIPIRRLVSKSLETARIAIPILVWLISVVSSTISTTTRMGVMMTTSLVEAPAMLTVLVRASMAG